MQSTAPISRTHHRRKLTVCRDSIDFPALRFKFGILSIVGIQLSVADAHHFSSVPVGRTNMDASRTCLSKHQEVHIILFQAGQSLTPPNHVFTVRKNLTASLGCPHMNAAILPL